jgi:acyl-ACP thioesterase
LASLLNYFQDCSTFHSEDLGVGMGYLKERHLVWVLASWQIVVEHYPNLCEKVEIGTFPYEFKGFLGCRNYFIRTKEGEYLAKANSFWGMLNTDDMKPTSPPGGMLSVYRLEPRLDMEYLPRRIPVPEGGLTESPILIKKNHLDTNRHVNNGQFIDMAMEFLPEGFSIHQMRAEYKKQAWLGDILYPYKSNTEGSCIVSLRDGQGNPYVNVEFS